MNTLKTNQNDIEKKLRVHFGVEDSSDLNDDVCSPVTMKCGGDFRLQLIKIDRYFLNCATLKHEVFFMFEDAFRERVKELKEQKGILPQLCTIIGTNNGPCNFLDEVMDREYNYVIFSRAEETDLRLLLVVLDMLYQASK